MANLKLITTETFGDLSCNFYRNMNDDILLTREQIGQALDYADPSKAIRKIHLKHKDRLEPLCIRIKGSTQIGANLTKSEEQERVYYTERGIMELCRWSRQPKANLFMDWVWEIVEAYRHNELTPQIDITPLTQAITTLTQSMTQIQQDMYDLKQEAKRQALPQKRYSRWKANTFNKLRLLTDYVNKNSDEQLTLADTIHITINEMQDLYDMELSDYTREYMLENSLDTKPYDLDVINYYKDIKELYTLVIDSTLDKLNLKYEPDIKKNIFDELAENL